MRKRRYLAPWRRQAGALQAASPGEDGDGKALRALSGKPAIYHCVSRVVDRRFVLGDAEKEQFVEYMRAYEAFGHLRVLTYCVMSNHFHILVEVPERPAQDPGDEELLRHLKVLYAGKELAEIRWQLGAFPAAGEPRGGGAAAPAVSVPDVGPERVHEVAQAAVLAVVQRPQRPRRVPVERAVQECAGGGRPRGAGDGGVYRPQSGAGGDGEKAGGLPLVRICRGGGGAQESAGRVEVVDG